MYMKIKYFLKRCYVMEWNYFRTKLRFPLIFIVVTFLICTTFFFFGLSQEPKFAIRSVKNLAEIYHYKEVYGPNRLGTSLNIFLGNIKVAVVIGISGIIPFLFFPIWNILIWGFAIGAATVAAKVKGMSLIYFLFFGILPHGIFELLAIFYSMSIGTLICNEISKKLIRRRNVKTNSISIFNIAKNTARSYVLVIIPLLALAAVIEAFITSLLIGSIR